MDRMNKHSFYFSKRMSALVLILILLPSAFAKITNRGVIIKVDNNSSYKVTVSMKPQGGGCLSGGGVGGSVVEPHSSGAIGVWMTNDNHCKRVTAQLGVFSVSPPDPPFSMRWEGTIDITGMSFSGWPASPSTNCLIFPRPLRVCATFSGLYNCTLNSEANVQTCNLKIVGKNREDR